MQDGVKCCVAIGQRDKAWHAAAISLWGWHAESTLFVTSAACAVKQLRGVCQRISHFVWWQLYVIQHDMDLVVHVNQLALN